MKSLLTPTRKICTKFSPIISAYSSGSAQNRQKLLPETILLDKMILIWYHLLVAGQRREYRVGTKIYSGVGRNEGQGKRR